jgi:carbamoylphosphate synthase small subunit
MTFGSSENTSQSIYDLTHVWLRAQYHPDLHPAPYDTSALLAGFVNDSGINAHAAYKRSICTWC